MRLTIFSRTKYMESISRLKARNAPTYVIEAYKEGHSNVINEYYKAKLHGFRNAIVKTENNKTTELEEFAKANNNLGLNFISEALSNKDIEFLRAFFRMSNMDITSGNKLPPNASKLIKQGIVKDLGLKDLYKQLR